MVLFLTICFVTPSLPNFCQKIISFQFFEMGLTSPPPIWTMSVNILFVFLDVTPYKCQGVTNIQTLALALAITKGALSGIRQSFSKLNSLDSSLVLRVCGEVLILVAGFLLTLPFFSSTWNVFTKVSVQDDVYSLATISAAQGELYHRFLNSNYSKHCQVKMAAMHNLSWYLKKKMI